MGSCEISQGEKMLYSGTDPESHITEYTLVYEDYLLPPTPTGPARQPEPPPPPLAPPPDSGFRASGFGFRVWGVGFRV